MKGWKRFAAGLRTAGLLVIVGLLGFIGYQVHDFYAGTVNSSPIRVTQDYFSALGEGDFAHAYELTDPDSLVTLYGRHVSQSEVTAAYTRVAGEMPTAFARIVTKRLARKDDFCYVEAQLYDNAGASTRVVVEVVRKGGIWRVTHPFGLAR